MDLNQIKASLQNPDSKERLKAITELKNYDAEIAIPLLLSQIEEPEFLVRSFVAMGLGKKHTEESFAALLKMIKLDRDSNVRAEAANSLANFGEISASHLVTAFYQDDNWLVRHSIIAALAELNTPDALLEVCICGINGEDLTVQEACIDGLVLLANTAKKEEALTQILLKIDDANWRIRLRVAKALSHFAGEQAEKALQKLKQDSDHRVVGAALEKSLN